MTAIARRALPALAGALFAAVLAACARADVGAARAQVGPAPVVLLSATWCGYCRRLRADLERAHVTYAEFDVETSDAGRAAYQALAGRAVPILLVGDEVFHGYTPGWVRDRFAPPAATSHDS